MVSRANNRILLVEDTLSLARVYMEYLRNGDYNVTHVATGEAALSAVQEHIPSVILLDLRLPDMDGFEVLERLKSSDVPSAVVVITAHGSVNVAVDAMRRGAFDFLMKPFNADRLKVTVANALQHQRLSRMVASLQEDLGRRSYCGFIGASLPMQGVYRIIDSAASSKATVFVTGESGTGKELAADAIHRMSPRAENSFVALNCGAIPKDLMESEIFGHVKGAFTGAHTDRPGAAERANGGTLFLDEICEMSLDLQTKLLRFIQTGTFQPVGGRVTKMVDVRFVCATNRDPLEEVRAGRFREDLYYRLHVIPIHLPPLRDRDQDVVEIAEQFLRMMAKEEGRSFAEFSPDAERMFLSYDWPGNVRQLQNVVRNIVVLNEGEAVTPEMIPEPVYSAMSQSCSAAAVAATTANKDPEPLRPAQPLDENSIRPLWIEEKEVIERAVRICGGNIPKAAGLLGVSASTIYRKRQAWDDREISNAS